MIYEIGSKDINIGDKCKEGSQLRPHIVWFHEAVPKMQEAVEYATEADIFIVVGTSMEVYPAASLIQYAPDDSLKYLIDPHIPSGARKYKNMKLVQERGATGVPKVVNELLSK